MTLRKEDVKPKSEAAISQSDFINGTGKIEEEIVAKKQQTHSDTVEHKGKTYTLASVQPEQPRSAGRESKSKKVWVKDDVDLTKEKRKRNVHGTAINVPMYVEEFRVLEAAHLAAMSLQVEKGLEVQSFSEFVRDTLVKACSKQIKAEDVKKITAEKINQIMAKSEEINSLYDDADKRTIG